MVVTVYQARDFVATQGRRAIISDATLERASSGACRRIS